MDFEGGTKVEEDSVTPETSDLKDSELSGFQFSQATDNPVERTADGLRWKDHSDKRHYGNCYPFLYYGKDPLCVIGPTCKHSFHFGLLLSVPARVRHVLLFYGQRNVHQPAVSCGYTNHILCIKVDVHSCGLHSADQEPGTQTQR